MTSAIQPPEGDLFRQVLGHLPTGVTVITGSSAGKPVGMACNSFTSVSLDPPLVSFCAALTSETWPLIRAAGVFAVNVLGHHQEELGRRFARRGVDRFADVAWHHSIHGSPLLEDAVAWLDCTLEGEHEAGDHTIAIGRVHRLGAHEGQPEPLLFYRGRFGSFRRPPGALGLTRQRGAK